MKFLLFQSVVFTILLSFSIASDSNTVVETHSGSIEGKMEWYDKIAVRAYLGIPYAKTPTDDLRFKKPVPYGRWNTTFQATTLRHACVQHSIDPFPWVINPSKTSLDCLYLNIWTPMSASRENKKTVIFWIHTGGFKLGSSNLDELNGRVLSADGDVIVVTFNYRLGVEGFYYSGTEDAPGNMGLWDIVEAFKWVRANIKYFGGDENSITVSGQSAGGLVAGMMCVSPVTRGLFKRVIMQSGTPTTRAGDKDNSFEFSQKVAVAVGCAHEAKSLQRNPKQVVECLRDKDGYMLAIALSNVTSNQLSSYYPRFGDDLLPRNARLAIIEGDFAAVDVMIGSNIGDGATLITRSMKDVFGFFGEKNPQVNYTLGSSLIRKLFKDYPDPDALVKHYLGKVEEYDYDEMRLQAFTAAGDGYRTCTSNYFAESFAKKNVMVYMYFFTHRPSVTPWAPWMLAVHRDETPFVFGYPVRYPHLYLSEEVALSKHMICAWSSFAKTGVPNCGKWPLYSKEIPFYQELDVGKITRIGLGPHYENCNLFRSYFGF